MGQGPYCFCFKTFILTQEVCLYCSANNQSSLIAEHSQKMGVNRKAELPVLTPASFTVYKPSPLRRCERRQLTIWSHFAPFKEIWIPDSGMREVLLVESEIRENLAVCENRNPGPWNPEYS